MSPTTTPCPICGELLSAEDIFCKHCFTMNPMVRDFLKNNPKQHPIDYLTIDSTCPLCGKKTRRVHNTSNHHPLIHSPIRYCLHCEGYYLRDGATEWCVAPHSSKSQLRLLTTLFIYVELSISALLREAPYLHAAVFLLHLILHLPIGYLYLRFTLPKAIRDSNLRLERNSDYPQILEKMGYGESMHEKQPFKEFLKDAFTFD